MTGCAMLEEDGRDVARKADARLGMRFPNTRKNGDEDDQRKDAVLNSIHPLAPSDLPSPTMRVHHVIDATFALGRNTTYHSTRAVARQNRGVTNASGRSSVGPYAFVRLVTVSGLSTL